YVLRSSVKVANPSISGISTSRMTRSGLNCGILARAIRPLAAVPTTSKSGSPASSSDNMRRKTAESSTTRMRSLRTGSLRNQVEHVELRNEDVFCKWLHDVFIGAGIESPRHLLALRFRRHHDDAHAVIRALRAKGADE